MLLALPLWASEVSRVERGRALTMLQKVREDVLQHYYDPTFHGFPVEARFKQAEEHLQGATSVGQMMGIIARVLLELNDSHTYFMPPSLAVVTDYGWQFQAIGDGCYVVAVRPKSDAETKGVRPGDRLLAIDGQPVTRQTLWQFRYLYYRLRPRPGMRIVVQPPGGEPRTLDVAARVRQRYAVLDLADEAAVWQRLHEEEAEARVYDHRYLEAGDELFVWRMPAFDLSERDVQRLIDRARKRKALVLDLRGNFGGDTETLERLVGALFEREVTIGRVKSRKEEQPFKAATRGAGKVFTGKLVVLIDSLSSSAAEVLARLVQIEKRGTVLGDRSAGAVMRGRLCDHQLGADRVVFYAAMVTDADVVMSDGKSLEDVGVAPDEWVLPTPDDLRAGRDPALATAMSLAGVRTSGEQAGKLFPIQWGL